MPQAFCGVCSVEFYVKPSHLKIGWGKYCSNRCKAKSQTKGISIACDICQTVTYRLASQLKRSKSGKYFCSKTCQTKWRNSFFSEEKHPNWTGGETAYRSILQRRSIPKECACCKLADKRILAVHHLDKNRKNNHESNLLWVCHNCHYLLHHDETFRITFYRSRIINNY